MYVLPCRPSFPPLSHWPFFECFVCCVSVCVQTNRLMYLILQPAWTYFTSHGTPPFDPVPAIDDAEAASLYVDATWAETASIGDKVDWYSPAAEKWVPATIVNVSPTHTEVLVAAEGCVETWVSVEDGLVAPLGEGASRREAALAIAGIVSSEPAAPVDESWRAALKCGVLCDAYSSVKTWYETIVLAERTVGDVQSVKVRDSSGCTDCCRCWHSNYYFHVALNQAPPLPD